MGLPWARLDANIGTHPKIVALANDPSPKRWQAISSYMVSIGWAVGQGTDGMVPNYMLPTVFGTKETARLLEKYELWEPATAGWQIHNFAIRQQSTSASEAAQKSLRQASAKGNCIRWHGPDCGCWKDKQ